MNKRQKIQIQPSFSSTLLENEDALLHFLVRTPAADHGALKCVCKIFQRILNSKEFRRERMLSEWAEVDAKVPSYGGRDLAVSTFGESLDMGILCYPGILKNESKIFVDGKPAGSFELIFASRRGFGGPVNGNDVDFHDLCNDVDDLETLGDVGRLFFDDRARPILQSVKDALKGKDSRKNYMVYISKFELDKEYRQHTWVGACALRQVLQQRLLQGKWSIAIYIGNCARQFLSDENSGLQKRREDLEEANHKRALTAEETDEKMELDKKLEPLEILDLRQFLRAGFRQPKEAVLRSDSFHAFCVPDFLEQDPMLTHQEAELLPIIRKPRPPSEPPTGINATLQADISLACKTYQYLNRQLAYPHVWISQHREEILRKHGVPEMLKETRERQSQKVRRAIEKNHLPGIRELESEISKLSDDEQSRARRADLEERVLELKFVMATQQRDLVWSESQALERLLQDKPALRGVIEEEVENGATKQKEAWQKELTDNESQLKEANTKCLQEGGTVIESNALHTCANHLNLPFFDILFDKVPVQDRRSAINKQDPKGLTPLMAAAMASNCESLTEFEDHRYRFIDRLIDLGADKSITDITGETALGKYRGRPCDEAEAHQRYETTLCPLSGPTTADDAILAAEASYEEDDEDDWTDDDEDEW